MRVYELDDTAGIVKCMIPQIMGCGRADAMVHLGDGVKDRLTIRAYWRKNTDIELVRDIVRDEVEYMTREGVP